MSLFFEWIGQMGVGDRIKTPTTFYCSLENLFQNFKDDN